MSSNPNFFIKDESPRLSEESNNGNTSSPLWPAGSMPKLRIKIPATTKQKLAKVINKTLPSFIVDGLNDMNLSGNGSQFFHSVGGRSGNRSHSDHNRVTNNTNNSSSSGSLLYPPPPHPVDGLAIPNISHRSLHHARSATSFASGGSLLSHGQPPQTVLVNDHSETPPFGTPLMGAPLTRYYSWSSVYSGAGGGVGNGSGSGTGISSSSVNGNANASASSNVGNGINGGTSTSSNGNNNSNIIRSSRTVTDRDSNSSYVIGETESGIAFPKEDVEEEEGEEEEEPYLELHDESPRESNVNDRFDPIKFLPLEITLLIFQLLDIESLSACSLVSHDWKGISESDIAWRHKFYNSQPLGSSWQATTDFLPSDLSWKGLYKTRYLLEQRWLQGKVTPRALAGHSDGVYCVHIDSERIVTGSRDRSIKVWEMKSGKLLHTLGLDNRSASNQIRHGVANVTTNTTNARTGSSASLNITNGTITASSISTSLSTNAGGSNASANTNSGSTDNITTNNGGDNNTAANVNDDLRNLPSGTAGLAHTGSVLCLALDDKIMVSGSSDTSCIIWQLPKFKPIKQIYRHSDGVLDISLNETRIASCSKDSTISIWDRQDPNYSLQFRLHGHRGPVNALQIKGDHIFSAGGDGAVKMWRLSTGSWIRDFKGHTRGLACVQASEDGSRIVSGGSDNTIRVWDVKTGTCMHVLEGHKGLVRSLYVFSNKIISGSYDQTIHVWDISSGKLITNLNGWHGSWIFSAKADCKRIVSTSFGTKPVILDFSEGLDKSYLNYIKN